jgi:hypothetical protein
VGVTLSARAQCWHRSAVLIPVLVGCDGVVAGGFVAAATAPVPSEKGSWAAAYLVLVVGVAQLGLVAGVTWLPERTPSRQLIGAEFLAWNLGNAAVLAGTLLEVQPAVAAGGALIVLALLAALVAVRPARPSRMLWTYRVLIAIVLVSVPVGVLLGQLRSG